MAGRTLTFPLEDGTTVDFIGPWKTGAEGLRKDTGYDATKMYTSQGIISLYRENAMKYNDGHFYIGVLHHDPTAVIGPFDRIEEMAQSYANKFQRKIWYAVVTSGGGTGSWCDPEFTKEEVISALQNEI